MMRFLGSGLAVFLLISPELARAQSAEAPSSGRSAFVPMLKLELLDETFAVGGIEGDAAHEARFSVTATTGGMRAGDGTWGEKMVGFRVPLPQIVEGGAGLLGVAGDNAPGAPRVIMTQPLTDENGVALGKVVSGMRLVNVKLAYPGATAMPEETEIRSAWNEAGNAWSSSRILPLDKGYSVTYRMSFERDGQKLPIRGHKMKFSTSGLAGQLWRRDYGLDLDGDGAPDGDYIPANFKVPDSNEGVLSRTLFAPEFERLTRWQPSSTRGEAGAYTSRAVVRYDPRFVADSLGVYVYDDNAYEAFGNLEVSNEPRALQPRPLRLEKIGPAAPAVWNRATVVRLLRDIEKPRNAALLRGLYFGAHRPHALPVEEGRKLLQSATTQAKPASRRWFLLMSLRGFAGLRSGEANSRVGFDAYRVLFDAADKAPAAHSQTIVRAAVADFVNMASLGYDQYKLSNAPGDNAATIAAWKAYSQSQKWPQSSAERAAEPLWNLRWQKESLPIDLVLYIARQSANWKDAPLDWRFAAAGALSQGNQQRAAFALWSQLKDELGARDLDRLNIVYDRLMDHATWLGSTRGQPHGRKALQPDISWKEAEKRRRNLAQERTQRWDFGWAERLELAPDGAAQMRIARQLLARPRSVATRDELVRAVRAMFTSALAEGQDEFPIDNGAANTTGVLARGLLAQPNLPRERQWEARLLLATLLERLGRRPEAVKVLAPPFGAPPTKAEDDLLERVKQMRAALDTKN